MSGRRRFALVIATLVGLPLALAMVGVAAVVAGSVFGVSIDVSRWRDAAAQQASAALGRPVALSGALELTLGREWVLRIGGVQILNPPGFEAPQFLSVGEARARFDLLDALRGRPRLRSLEASDIGLWLERRADGRANWASAAQGEPASPQPEIDLGQVTLHRAAIAYLDARAATRRSFVLDELSASARTNDPLRLALRGRVDGTIPYAIRLDGGPIQRLQSASEPWPFTLTFESAGARLHAGGALDARQGEARFDLNASADDLARAGRLLGATLPQVGAAALYGTVAATAEAVALTNLRGTLGEAGFSGQLALAFAGARPRLSGALSVAALDVRPFLATDLDGEREPFDIGAMALRDLAPLDVDVELSVGRWLGLPVDIRDARLALHADTQGLRVPMNATLAGAAISGLLDLDTGAPTPKLALHVGAKDLALGTLARELTGEEGIQGRLGRFDLEVGGRGETVGALVHDLELSLAVAALHVRVDNVAGGRPIAFTLDTLGLAATRGERLRGTARGSLLGERAQLSIRGGTLPEMLRERATPVELTLALAEATLRIEAALGRPESAHGSTGESTREQGREQGRELVHESTRERGHKLAHEMSHEMSHEVSDEMSNERAVRFDLQARRSGDLARWLPVAPASNLPVALRGRLRIGDDGWALDATTLKLGRSEVTLDAQRTRADGRPLTTATVRSPLLDVPELLTLRVHPRGAAPAGDNASASDNANAGKRLDAPIFSSAIELADADLALDLQHVLLGRTDLVDVGLVARTREGRLLPSSVSGKLAGAPFTALVDLDLRGDAPLAKLDLSTGAIDIGRLLRGAGLAEDIDGRVDALHLTLQGRGNTLREFAAQAAVEARLLGGSLTVLGAAQRAVAEIRVNEAVIGAVAGEPIRGRLHGTLDRTPVKIELSTGSFAELANDGTRLPFALAAQAARSRLTLEGDVTLPLGSAAQLTFELSGERLDSLSDLARVELPPWGPWSLRGPIRVTPTRYELDGLQLAVGQSRLSGTGTLDLSGPRPRLEVQVAAPTIQLDDFPLPERLIDPPAQPGNANANANAYGLRVQAGQLAGGTDRLLSAGFLRRIDATVDVQAGQVLSGVDRLGDGGLHLELEGGRLHLDPAVVNLPGGTLRMSISYDLKESEVEFGVAARIERFDYGIIARRLGRPGDLRGKFSLNAALSGRAPSLDAILRNANGRLDFAVWPTELSSGMFRMWSLNLVLTLLPLFDPGGESQVNCIVGRFDLKNGDLTDDKILIDTTALRIRGTGHANLATEELDFVFRPRAKGLALFRLQNPLRVTGTLENQRFGTDRRDAFESALRWIASPILLPIERLTLGPLPRDGADLCSDPLRANGR